MAREEAAARVAELEAVVQEQREPLAATASKVIPQAETKVQAGTGATAEESRTGLPTKTPRTLETELKAAKVEVEKAQAELSMLKEKEKDVCGLSQVSLPICFNRVKY